MHEDLYDMEGMWRRVDDSMAQLAQQMYPQFSGHPFQSAPELLLLNMHLGENDYRAIFIRFPIVNETTAAYSPPKLE